jgi:hypothetical protein
VSCTAQDASGNKSAAQSFNVTVQDTTPPVLTVPADITAEATSASGAKVTFTATATDAVDPSPTVTCTPASGSTFIIGTTPVSCTAEDAAGNQSDAQSFNVTVKDTTPPAITVPQPITAEATSAAGAKVTYTASATDVVDGAVTPSCSPASGSTFALGVTEVSCTAVDAAGNSATKKFDVTVKDTTAPTLTVPGDMSAAATSAAGAVVTYTATATDLVDPSPTVTCTPASGSTFGLGATQVKCTARDAAGNTSAAKAFTVTVAFSLGSGFLAPVDNASAKIINVARAGSTVPLKFQVSSGSGGYVSDTNIVQKFTAGLVACSSTSVPDDVITSAGSTSLRYDATANQFIQNWQTPKSPGKCYRAVVTFVGGQTLQADFQLK